MTMSCCLEPSVPEVGSTVCLLDQIRIESAIAASAQTENKGRWDTGRLVKS